MSIDGIATFDALVVGAGPAGAYLAYLLAKQGLAVAVAEKQPMPRDKVCGGGLSRKAIDLLEFDMAPVTRRTIRGAFLTYANRATLLKDIDPPIGCTVVRAEFDEYLLDQARRAGAVILAETAFEDATQDNAAVTVRTSAGMIRCRHLLAADGVASDVRSKVFGKQVVRYVPALEAIVELPPAKLACLGDRALFDFAGMPKGYGWIFPKGDHVNVGVYSPYGGRSLRRHLDNFMARFSMLSGGSNTRYLGYAIPIANRAGRYEKGRIWLVGDAAGLAEAVFGEGIYFALKSASLAARAVAEDAGPLRYTALLKRELLPELRAAAWLGKALYRFPSFSFHHLVLNQRINHLFAGLISGETGYRECLAATAMNAFRWLIPSRSEDANLRL